MLATCSSLLACSLATAGSSRYAKGSPVPQQQAARSREVDRFLAMAKASVSLQWCKLAHKGEQVQVCAACPGAAIRSGMLSSYPKQSPRQASLFSVQRQRQESSTHRIACPFPLPGGDAPAAAVNPAEKARSCAYIVQLRSLGMGPALSAAGLFRLPAVRRKLSHATRPPQHISRQRQVAPSASRLLAATPPEAAPTRRPLLAV